MRILVVVILASVSLGAFAENKCTPTPQPQFAGAVMCHETALELENVNLKLQITQMKFNEQFTTSTAKERQALAVLTEKILTANPDYYLDPQTGGLALRPKPAPAPVAAAPAPAAK